MMKEILREVWSGQAPLWKAFGVMHVGTSLAAFALAYGVAYIIAPLTMLAFLLALVHFALTLRAVWICSGNTTNPALTKVARLYVPFALVVGMIVFWELRDVVPPGQREEIAAAKQEAERIKAARIEILTKERLKASEEECAKRFDKQYMDAGYDPAHFLPQRTIYIRKCVPAYMKLNY